MELVTYEKVLDIEVLKILILLEILLTCEETNFMFDKKICNMNITLWKLGFHSVLTFSYK